MKKRLSALLLTVVMIASLAACGTKTPPAATGTDNAAVKDGTQGVTDTEILIGNSAAVSGAYAPVGVPFIAGIQAYLDMNFRVEVDFDFLDHSGTSEEAKQEASENSDS